MSRDADVSGSVVPWLEPVRRRFAGLAAKGRLPHALLLSGPPGIGKQHLAEFMVASLLCETVAPGEPPCRRCRGCVQHRAGSHPDCSVLSPDPASRTAFAGYPPQPSQADSARRRKAPQRRIEIGQVRDLAQRLTASAHYGGHRVAVLVPADRLRYEAANALLKLLEEPGDDVLFLLVADSPGRLPATIRSRCQWLRCMAPDRASARRWLAQETQSDTALHDQALELALELALGAPFAARQLLQEGDTGLIARLVVLLAKGGRIDPISDAAQLDPADSESVLRGLVTVTAVALRLAFMPGAPLSTALRRLRDRVEQVDFRAVLKLNDWVVDLRRHDGVVLNSRLLLEQFLARWSELPAAPPATAPSAMQPPAT